MKRDRENDRESERAIEICFILFLVVVQLWNCWVCLSLWVCSIVCTLLTRGLSTFPMLSALDAQIKLLYFYARNQKFARNRNPKTRTKLFAQKRQSQRQKFPYFFAFTIYFFFLGYFYDLCHVQAV